MLRENESLCHSKRNVTWRVTFSTIKSRFLFCRSQRLSSATRQADVHTVPNARARKRISLQPLFNAKTAHRNRSRPLSDGATDKNLVPESANETEKRTASRQGDQRAGEAGTRRAGTTQTATARKATEN